MDGIIGIKVRRFVNVIVLDIRKLIVEICLVECMIKLEWLFLIEVLCFFFKNIWDMCFFVLKKVIMKLCFIVKNLVIENILCYVLRN